MFGDFFVVEYLEFFRVGGYEYEFFIGVECEDFVVVCCYVLVFVEWC